MTIQWKEQRLGDLSQVEVSYPLGDLGVRHHQVLVIRFFGTYGSVRLEP